MNTSFSPQNPYLQLAVDSTSLGEYKTCPARYQMSIVQGFVPRSESVHLTFGLLLHGGVEVYHRAAFSHAQSHDEALLVALEWVMTQTWDAALDRPWTSDDKYKNRFTLARTLIDYLDRWQDDPIRTIQLANGKPAVELSFRFDSGYRTSTTDEPILLCGHLDRIARLNDQFVIPDIKTTRYTISQDWFDKFTPDNQFSLYPLAGKIVFNVETDCMIVDGVQVLVDETRLQRGLVHRTAFQLEEWHEELRDWLADMEQSAVRGKWRHNDKSCGMYGGCPYRGVCSAGSQSSRDKILSETFRRRTWDPLQKRGDI